jgi:hypothetical protein
MKLLLFKKNPARIPGHGGKEFLSKESDIEITDPQALNVGDKVFIADEYFNIREIEVLKIRWDRKAITHSRATTLSDKGNPFGAPSNYVEYEFSGNFPLFTNKEGADKFADKCKSESGYDCDHPEEWRIAKSYEHNFIIS